jgi:mRNA interferase RelE/StbE
MAWTIKYLKEVEKDLLKLDHAQRLQVLKAIEKVSKNPLPNHEGGYGKPLGNTQTAKLFGYYKITLLKLGIRVVYGIVKEDKIMKIVVISMRDNDTVYAIADKRTK